MVGILPPDLDGFKMNILTSYLSGRVSASFLRKTASEPLVEPQALTPDQEWTIAAMRTHGIEAVLDHPEIFCSSEGMAGTLGSSSPVISEKLQRRPKGVMGISTYGRNLVKDSATFLQRKYGRSKLSFLTCTLPPSKQCDREQWGRCIDLLRRKISYHLKAAGLPPHIVGVTEIQEKRLENTGDIYLHIHWLFVGRRGSRDGWEFNKEFFRELWRDTVDTVLGTQGDTTDWSAATRIEPVRKDASGYMGKYMSKGSKTVGELRERGYIDYIPSAWYTCTEGLKTIYKKNLYVVSGKVATELFDALMGPLSHLLKFSKFVKLESDSGYPIVVGWYGEFISAEAREMFCSLGRDMKKTLLQGAV